MRRRSTCDCGAPVSAGRWYWCSGTCQIADQTERAVDARRQARHARVYTCRCGRALPPRVGRGGVRRYCAGCIDKRRHVAVTRSRGGT